MLDINSANSQSYKLAIYKFLSILDQETKYTLIEQTLFNAILNINISDYLLHLTVENCWSL